MEYSGILFPYFQFPFFKTEVLYVRASGAREQIIFDQLCSRQGISE